MSGTFTKVCTLDDVWEGEMETFTVNGHEILLVCAPGGEISAFQGICPHQDIPLVEGKFDGKTLICRAHLWQFDVTDGKGINPDDCALAKYPVQIDGEDVLVCTEGVAALFAHS
ncbi:Rieske 2Fe-2S domain-containing protein [Novosphingobium sp. Fuku2-ISO-50]|jgi:toluene monooxygenase system ferredoxin subunit|uniref:Rieske 2Fe-2S domain-containing protein n=1 Tax=Novosphingobium sp. Fuku2-ISO-50 TaxID=1739114 RepID=UPI00076C51B4|nr:Rieske 2Fe-2S domain-containing protein [Novosphingobium sp. Fuku2-ISO-50]KUR76757.1 2Fe-2S ferredoxin [Novosphingobium sp. Fuku2-ISO-50]